MLIGGERKIDRQLIDTLVHDDVKSRKNLIFQEVNGKKKNFGVKIPKYYNFIDFFRLVCMAMRERGK